MQKKTIFILSQLAFFLIVMQTMGTWGCGGGGGTTSNTLEDLTSEEAAIVTVVQQVTNEILPFVIENDLPSALELPTKAILESGNLSCTTSGSTTVCECPDGGKVTTRVTSSETKTGTCFDDISATTESSQTVVKTFTRDFEGCKLSSCGSAVTLDGSDNGTVFVNTNSFENPNPLDTYDPPCQGTLEVTSSIQTITGTGKEPKDYCTGMTFTTAAGAAVGGYGWSTGHVAPITPLETPRILGYDGTVCIDDKPVTFAGIDDFSASIDDSCTPKDDCAELHPVTCDQTAGTFGNPACAAGEVCGSVRLSDPVFAHLPYSRCRPRVACDPLLNKEKSTHEPYNEKCQDLSPANCPSIYDDSFCVADGVGGAACY